MSEFRVEKQRVEAMVTLSNGTSVQGCVFVSPFNVTHSRPESVKDLLNEGTGFFPFEVVEPRGVQIRLFNRAHVVFVTLASDLELRQEPGAEVATRRPVSMLFANGERRTGFVPVARPRGRDRLSDHTRWSEQFWYFEVPPTTLIVNAAHVLELMELSDR